ncbi:ATP synthase subunit I [Candidatus Pelagadaptatus aseana]|uniref:ATP synthase subunit I n=1 Tax=Candidatus Pelagadaptatus aseana TaxID=3120508 RepID=UPI003C6F61FB
MPAVQAVVLGLSAVALSRDDKLDPVSYLIGGLIAVIPHLYFSIYAFRYMGARAARDITRSFYKGELGKYLLTLVGFALVFLQVKDVDMIALFGGYLFMLLLQWWLTAKVINRYQGS